MENEKKKITAYLIDTEKQEHRKVEIEDSLETYYRMLHCDCIDIVKRAVGPEKILYEIVCDDNGALHKNRISAIDRNGAAQLVGSLMVTGLADENGDLTSLSDDDAAYIESCIRNVPTVMFPQGNVMLTGVEYAGG